MTEDEAKAKWCPKFQVATSGGDPGTFETDNRPPKYAEDSVDADGRTVYRATGALHENCCCIASGCMAWRWMEQLARSKKSGTFHSASILEHDPDAYELMPESGYCG